LEGLTSQERKILSLMAEGFSNRNIAEHLHLAEQTVKNYVSSILTKLGVQRRTQATLFITDPPGHDEPDQT
jgi:DNA-binding NarL/FixJ family response regulator